MTPTTTGEGFTDTRQLAAKPSTRTLAKIDKQIEAIYYRVAQGVQINIMDIGKVYDAGRTAALRGGDVEAAVIGCVALLRRN